MIGNIIRLINELMGTNIPINEMATVGYLYQYSIVIESNDHNPPHFHVKLNNKTVCRIEIPRDYIGSTYDLAYLKNSRVRLSSRIERELIQWFNNSYSKKITNLEMLQYQWNALHPNDIYVWEQED